jgi:P pilus assembly chaperone PapD
VQPNPFFPPRRLNPFVVGAALVAATISSLAPANASAQAFTLAPTRLIFENNNRAQELTIVNGTDQPQTYRVRLEDRLLKEDGEFEVITDPAAPFVGSPLLRLSARQFVIGPRESATVRVLLRRPPTLAAGEYRSHLVVTELPTMNAPTTDMTAGDGVAVRITTVFGISIPILIRNGETTARLTVSDVKRVTPPETPNLETIDVKLSLQGNRSMFVDLRLVSTRQRRAAPILINKGVAIYAPLNSRVMTMTLDAEQTAKLRAGGVVLQYQEVNKDGAPIGPAGEIAF